MKKIKVKPNEVKYTMASELPFAGKGRTMTAKEWKRIYGYDVGLQAGMKFTQSI